MGRGFAWFDMGTQDSLLEAAAFVQTLEKRQGPRIACPEEIAYHQGFITHDQFIALGKRFEKSAYGQYLLRVGEARGLNLERKLHFLSARLGDAASRFGIANLVP